MKNLFQHFFSCLSLSVLGFSGTVALQAQDSTQVFQQWMDDYGDDTYLGVNSIADKPCVVQLAEVDAAEGNRAVPILRIHFRSSDPAAVDPDSALSRGGYQVTVDRFRTATESELRLIQNGFVLRRVEVPFEAVSRKILEFKLLDVFNKSYFNNCQGPYQKL